MKKLFNILLIVMVLVITSTVTQAQDKNYTFKYIPEHQMFSVYAPVSAFSFTAADDSISPSDSTYEIKITLNQVYPFKYDIRHKLDSLSGTPTTDVYLRAKVFDSDPWTPLDTISWAGTSSDTTIRFQSLTTAVKYRYFDIYHDCDSSTAQQYMPSELEIKLWPSP